MTTINTQGGMTYFHLAQLKGAIKLEAVGLRHSSGRSALAHAKKTYGFKGNREKVVEQIEKCMEEMRTVGFNPEVPVLQAMREEANHE